MCPHCLKAIDINPKDGYLKKSLLQIIFVCPRIDCSLAFFAHYEKVLIQNPFKQFQYTLIGTQPKPKFQQRNFERTINDLSPEFVIIYNQALTAEQQGLNYICGIGYRKAFEFLIKDYLCKKNESKADQYRMKNLGLCIEQDISNQQIKSVAKRATWIGNDETHYVRKYNELDVQDLKKLIELTLSWIMLEILTEEYEEVLPDKKV
jgi:hypothetical protein